MKQVRETRAGKSISAWVILKRHRVIATVHAHYSDGGRVLVNVFNFGKNRSAEKLPLQEGSAGGCGYDKFTAALAGMEIDGHKLTDHCGQSKQANPGALFPRDSKAPRGWHYANWVSSEWVNDKRVELPPEKQGYQSCIRESGLKYLEELGYTVFQVI